MNKKQAKMAEALIDMQLPSDDARWLQNIIINDSDLEEEEDYRLVMLYDSEFGYGMEE